MIHPNLRLLCLLTYLVGCSDKAIISASAGGASGVDGVDGAGAGTSQAGTATAGGQTGASGAGSTGTSAIGGTTGGSSAAGGVAGVGGSGGSAGAAGSGGALPEKPLTLEEAQARFVGYKYGMFLHFNMSTFARQDFVSVGGEHEQGHEDEKLFNPTSLNTAQWVDAAVAAGMKYMVLTTKHHGGFCLWDSAGTTHDVASSNWKGGKGDVLAEFVSAARAKGIRVGFYYSIWDKTNGQDIEFIKGQLTELLTNYGPIDLLWFDGWGWQVGYDAVPYETIRAHVKSLQPNCLILENNHKKALDNTEIVGFEQNVDGVPAANTLPAEMAGNIRGQEADGDSVWFYHPAGNCNLKSVDTLKSELVGANSGHANFLLDVTPDDQGLVPQCQVDRLKEVAAAL